MDRFIVHDRTGVKGQSVPIKEDTFIDIPEEYYEDLETIRTYINDLENGRNELGRLMQVVNHLINVCNTAETNLARAKQRIIKEMGLGDGNWGIDLEEKQIGKIAPVVKESPKVV